MASQAFMINSLNKLFSSFLGLVGDLFVFIYRISLGQLYYVDPRIIHEITRYFVVGILVSLGSAFSVIVIVEYFRAATPMVANTLCFFLWAPASYVGHKEFTFDYSGDIKMSAFRFFVVFGAKLLASILTMLIVQDFGYHYIFGLIANWVVIPVVNFIVLKIWVFK